MKERYKVSYRFRDGGDIYREVMYADILINFLVGYCDVIDVIEVLPL